MFLSRLSDKKIEYFIKKSLEYQNDDDLMYYGHEREEDKILVRIHDGCFVQTADLYNFDALISASLYCPQANFSKLWFKFLYKEFGEEYKKEFYNYYHKRNVEEYNKKEEILKNKINEFANSDELTF